jgi:ribosomal-protein-alanine N-acetyltransferase
MPAKSDNNLKQQSLNEKVFDQFPVLETERLVLRRLQFKDAGAIFRFRSNPEADAMKYMARPLIKNIEEAETLIINSIQSFTDRAALYWAIALRESDEFIGSAGYWRIWKENLRAEIGYQLLPEFQRKGYMYEALRAVISFGFDEYNLHSVEADTDPRNTASIKVLEKFGFVREAYFKENVYFEGEFLDSAIYSLLKNNS